MGQQQKPKHLNVQIANVSYQPLKLAEACGHYAHSHLNMLRTACRLMQAWHKNVRNVDIYDAYGEAICIQNYDYSQHSWLFKRFIKANTNHPYLAPFDGRLAGVWGPLSVNGQAVVLCINMAVTTTSETTTPAHVIQQLREICNRSSWLMWFLAACDIIVSDYDGNR